ncbi:MAG: nuclease-related domain-containing protein [Bacilli bacterium]
MKSRSDFYLLLQRLNGHKKYAEMNTDWELKRAGVDGERMVDQLVRRLPQADWRVEKHLRLEVGGEVFEPDFVLFSPRVAVIVEVKHYAGRIFFNDHNQCLQWHDHTNQWRPLPNPFPQLQRYERLLENYLEAEGHYFIPIYTLAVFTHKSCIIQTSDDNRLAKERAITAASLIDQILTIGKSYKNEILTWAQVKTLTRKLREETEPAQFPLMEKYKLTVGDLQAGLYCSTCFGERLVRTGRRYECEKCETRYVVDRVFAEALIAYRRLVGEEVTNGEVRRWTGMENMYTVHAILIRLEVPAVGEKRRRKYILTKEWEQIMQNKFLD